MHNKLALTLIASLTSISSLSCGGSLQSSIVGTWKATTVYCNGTDETSHILTTGTSVTFAFTSSSMTQTIVYTGCTSAINSYAVTYSSTGLTIANGSAVTASCSPDAGSCAGSGLSCSNTTATTDVALTASVSGSTLTLASTGLFDSTYCTGLGYTAPASILATKQ